MILNAMSRERAYRLNPNSTCALLCLEVSGKEYSKYFKTNGWNSFLKVPFYEPVMSFKVPEGSTDESVQDNIALNLAIEFAINLKEEIEDLVIIFDEGKNLNTAIAVGLSKENVGTLRLWDSSEDDIDQKVVALVRNYARCHDNLGSRLTF